MLFQRDKQAVSVTAGGLRRNWGRKSNLKIWEEGCSREAWPLKVDFFYALSFLTVLSYTAFYLFNKGGIDFYFFWKAHFECECFAASTNIKVLFCACTHCGKSKQQQKHPAVVNQRGISHYSRKHEYLHPCCTTPGEKPTSFFIFSIHIASEIKYKKSKKDITGRNGRKNTRTQNEKFTQPPILVSLACLNLAFDSSGLPDRHVRLRGLERDDVWATCSESTADESSLHESFQSTSYVSIVFLLRGLFVRWLWTRRWIKF